MRRTCAVLSSLALLLLSLSALARGPRVSLTPGERAQIQREIRAQAQWHFTLFEGRRPSLRTAIKPVVGQQNQFTAQATISAIWRGTRTPLVDNRFSITRKGDGTLTVVSPHPFIPR